MIKLFKYYNDINKIRDNYKLYLERHFVSQLYVIFC